jgi:hypothetical protein
MPDLNEPLRILSRDPVEAFPTEIVDHIFDIAIFDSCLKFTWNGRIETRGAWLIDTWCLIRLVSKSWYRFIMNSLSEEKLQRLWAANIILTYSEHGWSWQPEHTTCSFVRTLYPRSRLMKFVDSKEDNYTIARLYVKAATREHVTKAKNEVEEEYMKKEKYEEKMEHWNEVEVTAEAKKRKWAEREEDSRTRIIRLEIALDACPCYVPVMTSKLQPKPNSK